MPLNATLGRTIWRQATMHAVELRILPLVERILTSDPDAAVSPCRGGAQATPLHVAAFLGYARVAAQLLTHGAKADVATRGGRTPLDEAMYNGNHEVVLVLLPALPSYAQAAARLKVAEYTALPDASLRLEGLEGLGLPAVAKRRARVDPRPPDAPMDGGGGPSRGARCAADGDWAKAARQPVPASSPLAQPEVLASFEESMIDQRSLQTLGPTEYYEEYFLKGRPLLIRNAVSLADRCHLAASNPPMTEAARGRKFTCGATAYPELTGRKACGHFDFLELRSSPRCKDANRTRPLCNWKLGRMKKQTKVSGSVDWNAQGVHMAAGFKEMPKQLRHAPELPPLTMMRRAWGASTSRALWGDNPAYNVLFFGTKKWMITPPRYAGLSDLDSLEWPDAGSKRQLPAGLPLRFTQHAGDLVIVPAQWGHSTLSDGSFTLGLGVLWCDNRWMNLSSGECHIPHSWPRAGKGGD